MSDILEKLANGVVCESLESTDAVALSFARAAGGDFSLALSGGLGAGKTAFVKCLARAKGITQKVKSPSFNICCVYDIPAGGKFVHVDAYRFADGSRFEDLLLDEIAPSPRILCVEWAEIVADYFKPDYWLDFDIRGNAHTIKLRKLA